jgi:2',3'-cyclic-nucleotide 2'-phosphodiesterase
MKVLVIGDIVGSPGRSILKKALPIVFKKHDIDYCVANVENAAGGFGVTKEICDEILDLGVDCLTSGNHIWDKREILPFVDLIPQLLRPLNYPPRQPGRGTYVGKSRSGVPVATINVSGRVFMNGAMDDPFTKTREAIDALSKQAKVILVDVHAEASSEKTALANYVDGRASFVFGTHTHVPTADNRVLPHGTGYITDLGMTGPYDSVIGVEKEVVIERFLTAMPGRFETAKGDPRFAAAVADIDEKTGKTRSVERLLLSESDLSEK